MNDNLLFMRLRYQRESTAKWNFISECVFQGALIESQASTS